MATGDQADFTRRLKAVLPSGWFADVSPVLNTVLAGFSSGLAWAYSFIEYALAQVLIGTAYSIWLDLHAQDYFGPNLNRYMGESDTAYRARILAAMLPKRVTRAAMVTVLTNLTGRAPVIFEPWNTGDTGAYGTGEAVSWGGMAYGYAGAYGSLALPNQVFITAYRQIESGVGVIAGYSGQGVIGQLPATTNTGTPLTTDTGATLYFTEYISSYAPGGYGVGAIEYISAGMAGAQISDAQIYSTIAQTAAAGVRCWTRIES